MKIINNIQINIFQFVMILTFVTYLKFIPYHTILKDVAVGILLIYFIVKIKIPQIKFPSIGFVFLYITMSLIIVIHYLYNGFDLQSLISIRFLFIYLLLIIVGYNLAKFYSEKEIFSVVFLLYLIILLIGVLEIINPDLIRKYSSDSEMKALYRSGLGYGLGSIFGDRVIFAFAMTYLLVISRIFIKSYPKLFFLQILIFGIITLTLSKTAIYCSALIILFELIIYFKISKEQKNIIFKFIFLIFLTLTFLYFLFINNNILESLFTIFDNSNFTTLSGRTDNWSKLDLSIYPNFYYVGSSSLFGVEAEVTIDNAFLRLLTNYGLLILIPLSIIAIELILKWNMLNIELKYSLLIILFYSITVDFYHIAIVTIPLWFSIGYYLCIKKERGTS